MFTGVYKISDAYQPDTFSRAAGKSGFGIGESILLATALEVHKSHDGRFTAVFTSCRVDEIRLFFENCAKYSIKEALREIKGITSGCLWDSVRKELVLFNDKVGIKPVFYLFSPGAFWFGDVIPDLLRASGMPGDIERDKIIEYLAFRYITGEDTLYRGVQQLGPGQYVVFTASQGLQEGVYWDSFALHGESSGWNEQEIITKIDDAVSAALHKVSVSSPRTGVMLSGGIDSALFLPLLTQSEFPFTTYTIGFGAEDPDIAMVRWLQKKFGFDAEYINVDEYAYADNLPVAIRNFTFPVDHPNFVARDLLFRRAGEKGERALIAGEGVDTIFGGAWYVALNKYLSVKRMIPGRISFPQFLCFNNPRLKLLRKILSKDINDLILFDKTYTDFNEAKELAGIGRFDGKKQFSLLYGYLRALEDRDPLDRAFFMAMKTTLAIYPRDQVIMANAHGVDLGYPYLDSDLVELLLQVPSKMKVYGNSAKYLFKKVAQKYLPVEVLTRKKYGLPVPLAKWLRNEKGLGRYLEQLTDAQAQRNALYDVPLAKRLICRLMKGDDSASELLWVAVNLELWYRWITERRAAV